jgi:hypothetical protein
MITLKQNLVYLIFGREVGATEDFLLGCSLQFDKARSYIIAMLSEGDYHDVWMERRILI